MDGDCLHSHYVLRCIVCFLCVFGVAWNAGVGRRYIGQAKCYRLHCGHAFIVCFAFFLHLLSMYLVMLNICWFLILI